MYLTYLIALSLTSIANENNKGVLVKKESTIVVTINSKSKIKKYNFVANLEGLHTWLAHLQYDYALL